MHFAGVHGEVDALQDLVIVHADFQIFDFK
jgi:hypothetical protein